jgi:hypothetical protein
LKDKQERNDWPSGCNCKAGALHGAMGIVHAQAAQSPDSQVDRQLARMNNTGFTFPPFVSGWGCLMFSFTFFFDVLKLGRQIDRWVIGPCVRAA